MTPLLILKDVIEITKIIHAQVVLVQSNKAKLRGLADITRLVVSSLEGLSELPDNKQFIDSLTTLQNCLHQTRKLVQNLTEQGKMTQFFNAGHNLRRIDAFKQTIMDLVPFLNVGLSAQQLMNREQDRQAEAQDREYLRVQQEVLFREQQSAKLNPRDLDDIVRKQMASLEGRLLQQLQQTNPTSEKRKDFLPEEYTVNICDLVFSHKICDSDVGALYHGTWREQPVTIKWVDRIESEEERLQFMREAKVMSHLHHEHIVPFYGACFEESRLCLVMGVMEKGNLAQALAAQTMADRIQMAQDLARGLAYLHQQNIIHGDIKLSHIGVNRYNQAKWSDFGLVKTRAISVASIAMVSDDVSWQAPESWQRRAQLTPASDIYSFGLLLWSLYTGCHPYASLKSHEIMARVKSGFREDIPADCPPDYAALIRACWAQDSTQRPQATEIARRLQSITFPTTRPLSPTGEEWYQRGIQAQKERDLPKAFDYFQRSSTKDYIKAYTSIGLFKLEGLGGQAKDKKAAMEMLEKAAQGGHARAMFNIGRMYEKGDTQAGVIDYSTALLWYRQALVADAHDTHAKDKVELLSRLLENTESAYQYHS